MRALLAVAAALLIAAGPAQAQIPDDVTVEAEEPGTIPHNGTGTLNVTVTVGCAVVLNDPGSFDVEVTATSPNGSITSDTQTFSIGPDSCLTGTGTVSEDITLTLTPSQDAPGVVAIPLTVNATVAGTTGSDAVETNVSYRPGHTMSTDVDFPLTVNNGSATFNVTIEWTGNAPTMVMFEEQEFTQGGGSISGLAPLIRDPGTVETIQVTYQAPTGAWNESVFQFRNLSHWILQDAGKAGPFAQDEMVTWTFVAGESTGPEETNGGQDSPGAGLLLAGIALLGAALLARRR